jgi:hypothetical protein
MKDDAISLMEHLVKTFRRVEDEIRLKQGVTDGLVSLAREERSPADLLEDRILAGEIDPDKLVQEARKALATVPEHQATAMVQIALEKGRQEGAKWAVEEIIAAVMEWKNDLES